MLTDDHPPRLGGVAAFTARVGAELARRGHEVRVFARWRSSLEEVPGTRLRGVWGPSFGRWGGSWLALRGKRALFAADRVLATTWPVATGVARLGIPFDVVAHGSDVTCPPRDPSAFDLVWGRARRRFAMSRFLARRVDAEVLPAPVPLAAAPRERGTDWVYVARATPLKGGERFVRWVAAAGVRGHVVGDGPELPSWRALAARSGARITFHGALSPEATLRRIGEASLVLLVPRAAADGSGAEGLGLALVEAAAMGIPGVGCAVGGIPEALGPGLSIPDPDDDRAAVQAIATHPHDGCKAYDWARTTHGVERTVDSWNDA